MASPCGRCSGHIVWELGCRDGRGGNNAILRNYVVASGGGDRSLVSVGEIHPFFGDAGTPAVVADAKNGVSLATPQLIVARDSVGTRDVFELTHLDIAAASRPPIGAGGRSTSFTLSGPGAGSVAFDLAALKSLPPSAQSVSYLVGSDGYEVVFSIAKLSPELGAPWAPDAIDLVAYERLVPGDVRGGRYVSNLVSLAVVDVPAPGTLVLLGTAASKLLSRDATRCRLR